MRVGLIQVDGKFPNLALMKISAYHKSLGHEVIFPYDYQDIFVGEVDKVYAAVVFSENRRKAAELARQGAEVGGTGWDIKKRLPPEIEAMKPDYTLYGIDYGMGYCSQGCIRDCRFCVVPEKEGYIRHVQMPKELLNQLSKRIKFLDGNYTASPNFEECSTQIIDLGIVVDFTQGLDIRLINDWSADYIAAMKHEKRIHFAFDHIGLTNTVVSGIKKLTDRGIHSDRLTFFVLTNFDSTFKEDMQRINALIDLGVNPYVMIYDKANAPQIQIDLQRWCNSIPPIRKVTSFENYKRKVG